ncbi:MAG: hypothetical protein B6D46_04500 [Polyangiaceae bacterium UTPRO1]|nr:hypothetical protein [Myxococcales bacterium]OQY68128.1 MAG: hypothetical protein B6D46_04500 [Polyangiaceae bacterium UTPRO1]
MLALAATVTRHPRPVSKLLQVTRHRVVRWFRPPEAKLRRRRLEPHPQPLVVRTETAEKTKAVP